MAFGTGPWGTDGYGIPLPPPPGPNESSLTTSRAIDAATGRYLCDAAGNFLPMDDVSQRVLLLVSFASVASPFITATALSDQKAAITKALEPLTKGTTPAIQILDLTLTDDGKDGVTRTLTFKNLLTGTKPPPVKF